MLIKIKYILCSESMTLKITNYFVFSVKKMWRVRQQRKEKAKIEN